MEFAIAGMGMGGLCLANFLAKDGHKVTIYDQMKHPGSVGSGFVLQPTGLIVLDRLGLRAQAEARGQRIDRMLGKLCHTEKTVLDVKYNKGDYGVAIIRWALFDILFNQAINAGVRIETSHRVKSIDYGTDPHLVFENGTKSPSYDLVIDALGARSPLCKVRGRELNYGALWVNLPWQDNMGFDHNTLEQRYHQASNMIGILPLGQATPDASPMTTFFWSIKHEDIGSWKKDGLTAWCDKISAFWPQSSPFIANMDTYKDQIVHANYRHHTHINPNERGFTRIGDAYHATSPQLGQGANMAFLDAFALSLAIRANKTIDSALKDYVSRRRSHLMFYQLLSHYLTPFYQSDGRILPFLRDYLIAPTLRRRGLLHAMIGKMVTGQMLNPIKSIERPAKD